MKLTVKQVLFLLMSTLLVLAIVMGCMVFNRVRGMFQLGGPTPSTPAENPSASESIPGSSSVIPSSSQQETSAPHVHEYYKEKTISSTCDTQGYSLYSCSCGKIDIRDFENPLGHEYGEATVVEATCESDGYTERICSRCQKAERTNPTTANHKFGQWADIAVSTGEPTQEKRTCSVCKATEIRSLDTTNTWVIRKSTLEPNGIYTCYQIVVDLADTDNDPTIELYIGLPNKDLGFDYDKTGLTISYIAVGENKSYKVPVSAAVLTIYADGKVVAEKPEITEDPTPSTGPTTGSGSSQPAGSQPSSQPASQPTSQPTSQPESQPESQPSSSGPAGDQND